MTALAGVVEEVAPGGAAPAVERAGKDRSLRAWPLLILALPASVAVWSGWVGIGRMTGFGMVHPLPGLWDSFHIDTAVTLPVGVEAYAAYALRAWLAASGAVSARTRSLARWSAIGSLLLGMAGQVAYHLLLEAGMTRAPWEITMAVSSLPVLVLGMGAALAHMLRADGHDVGSRTCEVRAVQDERTHPARCAGARTGQNGDVERVSRMVEAEKVAARLGAVGQSVSRRALRRAGIHGSNAELGTLVQTLKAHSG